MRTLITGGLGFIGSNLADRLLTEGRDVIILDNAGRAGVRHNLDWLRQRHGKKLSWLEGDVRDFAAVQQAMAGAQMVFHLAAQVAVTTSVANPFDDFATNAQGTLNVLEAARQQKPLPIVLYTSTNKVYGGMEHIRIVERATRYEFADYPDGVSETCPLDFHSPYGCSKGAADQYVRDYHRIYSLPTVVFRMSCIYGPRQFGNEDQGWLAHFVITTARGERLSIYGDGKQVRDLLYVEDLVNAMLLATQRIDVTAGQVFNIGGGPANALSVWTEFSAILKEATGKLPAVEFGPWRPGDQRIYVSDIRRAAQTFGWQPRISPREGIARLAAWAEEAVAILGHNTGTARPGLRSGLSNSGGDSKGSQIGTSPEPTTGSKKPEKDFQLQNRQWWQANPMSYDWHKTIAAPEGSREFFDEIDRRFFSSSPYYHGGRPFERLIPFDQLAGKRVLEIGCGLGAHAQLLVEAGCALTCIDLTPKAVELTGKRLALRGKQADVRVMDGARLEFADAEFDFVWSWGVIHHSADTERVLREVCRVLKPSGEFRMMVYHLRSLYACTSVIRGFFSGKFFRGMSRADVLAFYTDGRIARHYTRADLARLLEQCGFTTRAVQVLGQKSELVPLPGKGLSGRLKSALLPAIPDSLAERLLARAGYFLFAVAVKGSS